MNILVIGNGFDLAHGLPTKYADFLNWVINEYNFFLYMKEGDADITKGVENITLDVSKELLHKAKYMSRMQYDIQHELWRMINSNIWLEYFINNPMYQKENWIDFENEISEVIQSLDQDMHRMSIEDEIFHLSKLATPISNGGLMFTPLQGISLVPPEAVFHSTTFTGCLLKKAVLLSSILQLIVFFLFLDIFYYRFFIYISYR